jgi:hypothetical protein
MRKPRAAYATLHDATTHKIAILVAQIFYQVKFLKMNDRSGRELEKWCKEKYRATEMDE